MILVAQFLEFESFGIYAVLTFTVITFANIFQGGIGNAATKFVGEHLTKAPRRVGVILAICRYFSAGMGALASVAVFILAPQLAGTVFARPELEPFLRIAAFAILFQVATLFQIGALQGFGAFSHLGRGGYLVGLGNICLPALGVLAGGTEGAVIGFVAASAARAIIYGIILLRVHKSYDLGPPVKPDFATIQMVLRFILPSGLAGLVTMSSLWLVTALVTRLPDGLTFIGILTLAHQVRTSVIQFPLMLNTVTLSILSKLKGEGNNILFQSVFWSNFWIKQFIAIFIIFILLLPAILFFDMLNMKIKENYWVVGVLLLSVVPELMSTSMYQLVYSSDRMWRSLFMIVVPRDFFYLFCAALLLPAYGGLSASIAYLAAHIVGLGATLLTARLYAPVDVWPKYGSSVFLRNIFSIKK